MCGDGSQTIFGGGWRGHYGEVNRCWLALYIRDCAGDNLPKKKAGEGNRIGGTNSGGPHTHKPHRSDFVT